ncbi:hypothetical protein ACHWQZ_G010525 [Mnemiopsis leidyi]
MAKIPFLVLFLMIGLLIATTEGKKKGGRSCKKTDEENFHSCLKRGFHSNMEGCENAEDMPDLKPKEKKKCLALEKKLRKCQFDCGKKPPMSPAEILARCSHSDMKFNSGDMFHKVYVNIEDCVRDCIKSQSCKAISYNTGTQTCYFKLEEGGRSGPTKEKGYISTNMDCDRSRVDLHCQRLGIGFSGADIRSLYSESMEHCVRLCRDLENCKSITYRESDGYCWLKSKEGGSSGPHHSAGHRSINMECDNKPITDFDCLREGINFYSAHLTNLAVADIQECAKHCSETEACKAITFRDSDHQCFLKSKFGGYYPQVAADYSSMNMECDKSKVDNMDCMRTGINFGSADMGNLVVSDREQCVKHCLDTEGCKSITYMISDNRCYLKSKRGGSIGPYAAAGYDSMNMECDNSPVKNLDCIRDGINFPGADLRNLVVEEKEECVKHCRDTEDCKAVVLLEQNSQLNCYLKSRRGGSAVPVASAGYQSMNMECDNSKVSNLNCLREDLFFSGADIGNTVVADEKACVKLCRDTENCQGFSFRLSDNRCYAKSRRGGSSGPSLERNFKSMNMECDNSPVTEPMKCLRRGLDFPGSTQKQITVADIEECVRHCRDTEDCQALTFREDYHYCYLKNERGGSSGPRVSPGYSSLNLECENSTPKQLQCPTLDERFAGSELSHLRVTNFEECLRRCRDTEDCQAVSYRETDSLCELKSAKFEWWSIKSHYISVNMDCDM